MDPVNYLITIILSLVVGLAGFVVAYKIFDWLTPGVHFSDQLRASASQRSCKRPRIPPGR